MNLQEVRECQNNLPDIKEPLHVFATLVLSKTKKAERALFACTATGQKDLRQQATYVRVQTSLLF